jgi:hypothetical protein
LPNGQAFVPDGTHVAVLGAAVDLRSQKEGESIDSSLVWFVKQMVFCECSVKVEERGMADHLDTCLEPM